MEEEIHAGDEQYNFDGVTVLIGSVLHKNLGIISIDYDDTKGFDVKQRD